MKTLFGQTKTAGGQNATDLQPLAADRWPLTSGRRAGFTLMEMLVVIVIIAVLIGMLSGAYLEAKNHAKRARAETQLRELVKAWTEYYEANNNQWPSTLNNQSNVPMTYNNLQYLFASGNTNNIPFIAINLQSGDTYSDPWGNPYKISFGTGQDQQESALRIAVSFPNRDRYR